MKLTFPCFALITLLISTNASRRKKKTTNYPLGESLMVSLNLSPVILLSLRLIGWSLDVGHDQG